MSNIDVTGIIETNPVQGQPTTESVRNNFAAIKTQLSTAKTELENLSGVTDKAAARSNLELGDSATKNVGTAAGTVAAGDHNHDSVYSTTGHDHDGAYQPIDDTLQSLSALGTAADKIAYTTGVDTWAETALTAFIRTLLDDADAGTARNTLGASAALWPITVGGTGAATAQAAFANLKQAATEIATGVVELATNTEALAGTDTTRAVTSAGLASAKSLAASGYMKLPGGLIIQWGQGVSQSAAGAQAITLPIAFPTAGLNAVVGTFVSAGSPASCVWQTTQLSTTTLNVYRRDIGANDGIGATPTFIAVGH